MVGGVDLGQGHDPTSPNSQKKNKKKIFFSSKTEINFFFGGEVEVEVESKGQVTTHDHTFEVGVEVGPGGGMGRYVKITLLTIASPLKRLLFWIGAREGSWKTLKMRIVCILQNDTDILLVSRQTNEAAHVHTI